MSAVCAEIDRCGPPHRRVPVTDVFLVVVLAALAVYVAVWSGYGREGYVRFGPWAGLGLQLAVVSVLLLRRQWPLTVLAVVTVVSVVMSVSEWLAPGLLVAGPGGEGVWVPVATPFASYSAVVYTQLPRVAWALTGALTLVATRLWTLSQDTVVGGLLLTAVPALLGLYVSARRGLIAALTERAERAERERFLLAEQARAEERMRLAGEMHDVVAHRVSLMVLHAGALRITAADEEVRAAAESLRAAGAQALAELRDVVGVLWSPDGVLGTTPPQEVSGPGTARLATLVEESRTAGILVDFRESGDGSRVSPVVSRTAYRLVQEALTNAHKHAPGSTVRVEVRYDTDRVRLTVVNTAPTEPADAALVSSGSGTGLKGLRRRIELVGGTFESGPAPDGGFEVRSVLPNKPAPGETR